MRKLTIRKGFIMEHSFHYMLMVNQTIFHKKLFDYLKPSDLTLGQPKVLDYLKDFDGMTQKDIAKACQIEPTSAAKVLQGMEEKGMIERRMLNGNRRSLHVFLTEKGRKLQKEVEDAFQALEREAFRGMEREEISRFMELFFTIYENLQRMGGQKDK